MFAWRSIKDRVASAFRYDALDPHGKRRNVPRSVAREDYYVRGSKHRALQANAADLARNLSLAAWMVRRHLDYVSQFRFHSRTGIDTLDDQIERLMREDATPDRADVAGKFGREKIFRLAEARRVLDGDCLLVMVRNGKLQGIKADLIDGGARKKGQEWINGVQVNAVGRPIRYAIKRRKEYSVTEDDGYIRASNAIHYGFFDNFAADQVRGVSPLVSALNPLRDVYENFDYALAKAKVSHIFAMSIYRDQAQAAEDADDEMVGIDEDDEMSVEREPYEFDLSKPNILNLDPGDRAEVLESRQPSSEFQEFTKLVIQVALKSLDIPFSFYDESHTNFFGSRAAWLHYERSCKDRRDDQIEMRRRYTHWKLRLWVQQGRLTLPPGMTVLDVPSEWVPRGMPWWDPGKEIRGHVDAIASGLDTPQRVCAATGTDFYDNVDEIAKANQYAESRGMSLRFAPVGVAAEPEEKEGDDDESET